MTEVQPLPLPTREFHGTVSLDPIRSIRDFAQIAEGVLAPLGGHVDTDVEITVTIRAKKAGDFDEKTIQDVTENARALNFDDSSGFSEG